MYGKNFHIYTDASKKALGRVVMQKDSRQKLRAIQLASRNLVESERVYSTFGREAAAMTYALKNFRNYLLTASFVVYSDHEALRAALEKADIHDRLPRGLHLVA